MYFVICTKDYLISKSLLLYYTIEVMHCIAAEVCDVSVAVWRHSGNPPVTILRLAWWPPTTRQPQQPQKLSTEFSIFCPIIIILHMYGLFSTFHATVKALPTGLSSPRPHFLS